MQNQELYLKVPPAIQDILHPDQLQVTTEHIVRLLPITEAQAAVFLHVATEHLRQFHGQAQVTVHQPAAVAAAVLEVVEVAR